MHARLLTIRPAKARLYAEPAGARHFAFVPARNVLALLPWMATLFAPMTAVHAGCAARPRTRRAWASVTRCRTSMSAPEKLAARLTAGDGTDMARLVHHLPVATQTNPVHELATKRVGSWMAFGTASMPTLEFASARHAAKG